MDSIKIIQVPLVCFFSDHMFLYDNYVKTQKKIDECIDTWKRHNWCVNLRKFSILDIQIFWKYAVH